MSNTNLATFYFSEWDKYNQIYKGGNGIALLMQVGSFYEILEKHDFSSGNARKISDFLNIILTKRNKNAQDSPYMCGFPCVSLSKYLPVLINNNFTVIQIDQDDLSKGERKVSQIYSLSTPPDDLLTQNEPILMSIFIDDKIELVGACVTNTNTGVIEVVEYYNNYAVDKLFSLIKSRYPSEIILSCKPENIKTIKSKLEIDESVVLCHTLPIINKYKDVKYQEEYIKKIYKGTINQSMLGYLVELNLEKLTNGGVISLMHLFDFLYIHNEKFLINPNKPVILKEESNLNLLLNTLDQLNICKGQKGENGDSLFSIINFTQTAIGRRTLKHLLSNPLIDKDSLNFRYSLSREIFNYTQTKFEKIKELLLKIKDIETFHRLIICNKLSYQKFWKLHSSYLAILDIVKILNCNTNTLFDLSFENDLNSFVKEYKNIIDTENENELKVLFSQNEIFFKKGFNKDLDDLESEINQCKNKLESFEKELSVISPVKLTFLENENKFVLFTTNIRANLIKEKEKKYKLVFNSNKSGTKITSDEIDNLSQKITINEKIIESKKLEIYKKLQINWSQKTSLFNYLCEFVGLLDVTYSNVIASKKFNYCCPLIKDSKESYIDVKELRHPIIERIIDTPYIPNDITLGNLNDITLGSSDNDKDNMNKLGGIVYSLNSGGKSSLLRSVGVSIVMAQAGLFVPASSFIYYPFKKLISQVDFIDNLFRSQSSFVSEMLGLKTILNESDNFTLVLADELCKGSEINSATAIFASAVKELLNKRTKFLMSTHLHGVSQLNEIKNAKGLEIWNLGVEIRKETIVFLRKLQKGPCDTLYGLEIAKALGLNSNFIKSAFAIRNNLVKKKNNLLEKKGSKYNSKKIMDSCEICNYTPIHKTDIPLDCHHILFQCNADSNGFTGYYHKNAKSNLVCLCKNCHQRVHKGEININGWIQTTNGVKLDWS